MPCAKAGTRWLRAAERMMGEARTPWPIEASGEPRLPSCTSEPQRSPPETIGGFGSVRRASRGVSGPTRVSRSPKTSRNRGKPPGRIALRPKILRTRGLNGGGRSLSRTRLWAEIPDLQGKYREVVQIPASGEASVSDPSPLDVLAGEFPTFGNREISASEHGFPPGRRTQGRERRSCQPPVFGNCWRFRSADFWHTMRSVKSSVERVDQGETPVFRAFRLPCRGARVGLGLQQPGGHAHRCAASA